MVITKPSCSHTFILAKDTKKVRDQLPLFEHLVDGVRPVQHHIALVVVLVRRQRLRDICRDLLHQVIRTPRVQDAGEATLHRQQKTSISSWERLSPAAESMQELLM